MRGDGRVALGLLCGLVESIAALREQGREILVVSSGSIGLGMERLGMTTRPGDLAGIQACAAVGQSRLMSIYEDAFDRLGCGTAQVLLTEDDFRSPVRHANLKRTLEALLALRVIPVINENDTVSIAELDVPSKDAARPRLFGDNDKLSALLSTHIGADLLVLLSDVEGLYDRSPQEAGAQLLREIANIDEGILAHAHGGNGRGRGGMLSKLEAARMAQRAGLTVVIANGRTPQVLERVVAGEMVGTRFPASPEPEANGSPDTMEIAR